MVRTRVEPKTFFANERTFLSWLSVSALLMILALSLLSTQPAQQIVSPAAPLAPSVLKSGDVAAGVSASHAAMAPMLSCTASGSQSCFAARVPYHCYCLVNNSCTMP